MKKTSIPKVIDEYLADVPEPARTTLNTVRAAIRAAAPPETTEGISYRIPAFQYNGPLVGFAAFPNHCTFFVMHGTALEAFQDDLKNYQISKGGIRFPVDQPLPAALIKKIVKARVKQNESKKGVKPGRG